MAESHQQVSHDFVNFKFKTIISGDQWKVHFILRPSGIRSPDVSYLALMCLLHNKQVASHDPSFPAAPVRTDSRL